MILKWCPKPDLNWHASKGEGILNPLCLPIPPLGQIGAGNEARTRDPTLAGRALPTELFPHLLVAKQRGVFYGFILLCQIKFVKIF